MSFVCSFAVNDLHKWPKQHTVKQTSQLAKDAFFQNFPDLANKNTRHPVKPEFQINSGLSDYKPGNIWDILRVSIDGWMNKEVVV